MTLRRLTLLRHGHAQAAAPGGDIDRALDASGRVEVAAASAEMATLDRPTLLLISNARRTRETGDILIDTLKLGDIVIEYLPELYLASTATLRRTLDRQSNDHSHLCLIGHNPGLSDFVFDALTDESVRERYRGLATAGWASWAFTAERWRDFSPDHSYQLTLG